MRYTHKRILKKLLKNYYKHQESNTFDEKLFSLYKTKKSVFKSFKILSAKNLITLDTDISGNLIDVTITNSGFTYFEDIKDRHFRFWLPVIISLISLIGSFRNEIFELISLLCK